jgi:hypothetical protein
VRLKLRHTSIALTSVLLLFIPLGLFAKRAAPKPVPPVIQNGVKYSAPNDNGRIGHIVASEVRGGKTLWDIKIFEIEIDPKLEEDVQWVFITELHLGGNLLRIRDERSRCYSLNLATKKVKKQIICL